MCILKRALSYDVYTNDSIHGLSFPTLNMLLLLLAFKNFIAPVSGLVFVNDVAVVYIIVNDVAVVYIITIYRHVYLMKMPA